MSKIRANKSGNKYQKDKITSYSVSIPSSIFKDSGFTIEDEITITTDGNGQIIIQKKEALSK